MPLTALKLYFQNERPLMLHLGMYSCAFKHSDSDLDVPGPKPELQRSHKQHSYKVLNDKFAGLANLGGAKYWKPKITSDERQF